MSFLTFSKCSLMFCCAKKECESIIEAHVGITSLPLIKKVFDFIILLIFSVFFFGFDFGCLNRSE